MYRILADVEFLDGTLKGMQIKDGHTYVVPDFNTAMRRISKIQKAQNTQDFFRCCVTGNRYLVSNPRYIEV